MSDRERDSYARNEVVESEDPYKVLGLPYDASSVDIKKAYRILARKYHPDRSKEENAEEKFKAIVNAYKLLSDPCQRFMFHMISEEGLFNKSNSPKEEPKQPEYKEFQKFKRADQFMAFIFKTFFPDNRRKNSFLETVLWTVIQFFMFLFIMLLLLVFVIVYFLFFRWTESDYYSFEKTRKCKFARTTKRQNIHFYASYDFFELNKHEQRYIEDRVEENYEKREREEEQPKTSFFTEFFTNKLFTLFKR